MILLTGYNGFIGQNIVKRFNEYWGIERPMVWGYIDGAPWDKITEIWHIGAISDTTCTNIEDIYFYNIKMTLNLFEKAIEYKIPVKFASSASVYGNTNYRRIINPLNHYAMSKATIDQYIEDNMHKFSKIQSYRFFNVYGKHEDHKGNQASPIYTFTKQAEEIGTIKIFENSNAYMRDFIWVEDVIDCMMIDKPSGIYDLGTGVARSFERVAEIIADKHNSRISYIPFPKHLESKYQYFTCSRNHFDHKFTSIEEYILKF
jgi:ADP-L-glycero-D-manno-heptose 6-epimerase